MKKLIIILYSFFFLLCLINYNNIIQITNKILMNFINIVIPSLFPLILLNNIFIKSGFFLIIIKKIPKLKEPLIILLTILLGAPSSLSFLSDLTKQNVINNKEKELVFFSFGGISFSFLYSLSLTIKNQNIYSFLLTYYIGEILIYIIFRNKNMFKRQTIKTIVFKKSIYFDSIKSSANLLLIIFVSSLLFNYSFMFNTNIFNINPLLCSLIEFSYSSFKALNFSYISPIVLMFILSFLSFSIYFQIYYLDSSYDLLNHIKKRWFISTINSCLFFIFFF